MNPKINYILLCIISICSLILCRNSFAGTCWNGGYAGKAPWTVLDHAGGSPGCEIDDINYCVGAVAADGDTVNVTKVGTCTWNDRLVTLTRAVNLIGAGRDATIINSNYSVTLDWSLDPTEYLIAIVPATPADNPRIRLSGFKFSIGPGSRGIAYINVSTSDCTNVRIDHIDISGLKRDVIFRYGLAHGVMDNSIIAGYMNGGGPAGLWAVNQYAYGTNSNFYIEDCTINPLPDGSYLSKYEGNGAFRYAFRYNTIIGPTDPGDSGNLQFLEQHGNQYNSASSCFGAELYGNNVTSVNNDDRPLEFYRQRGGQVMVFNNKMTATNYSKIYVMEEHPDNQGAGAAISPWGQPQHVSNSYYFSNYSNSLLLSPEIIGDNCTGRHSKTVNTPSIDACYHKPEIAAGAATGGSTSTLEDNGKNFVAAGVSVGDFVVNTSKAKDRYHAEQARIASISSANGYTNNVLHFSNNMYSSNDSGDHYRIVSSIGGVATGGSTTTLIDQNKNFVAAGVSVGNYVVNISKDGYTYRVAQMIASITTTVNENDTLNFSAMDAANDSGDVYYIARDTDGISTNKDYWYSAASFNGTSGVGCGTLANRPATCTTGVGYWATNQSCTDLTGMVGTNPANPITGTLYKCTAANTWTSYYTPYTYPHPLRTEAYDDVAPAAPINLSVQ